MVFWQMNQDGDENLSNSDDVLSSVETAASLETVTEEIWQLARKHQHDIFFLLSLLRDIEAIHRKIRTEMLETSLPATRNDLYQLVKDIEETGGWPYIERMKLRELLKNLELTPSSEPGKIADSED
jgi:hypothetical protein